MGWPVCNSTAEDEKIAEAPLFTSHNFTAHELFVAIAMSSTCIATFLSLFQIALQVTHFSRLQEQRAIIRILLMVPVYAVSNLLALIFYRHAIYYYLLGNAYAAIGLASFYQLLTAYVAADIHNQKIYFRTVKPKPWGWPLSWFQRCTGGEHGLLRAPRSGLTFYNITFAGVFQYCFVLITTSAIAAVCQRYNRYCKSSLHPAFGHIWIISINVISAVISGYCLSQFHKQLKDDFKEHKTTLKMFCVDIVLYLSTYQSLIISLLVETLGIVKGTDALQIPDLTVGIPSTLLCFEMAIVAVIHLWAYSWRSYRLLDPKTHVAGGANEQQNYRGGFLGVKAIIDSSNPWDLVKAIGRSMKWMVRDRKGRFQDASYTLAHGSQHSESNEYSGGLLASTRKPTEVMHHVAQEVGSNSEIGTPWAEVDVTENLSQGHTEDLRLMASNHYRGLET